MAKVDEQKVAQLEAYVEAETQAPVHAHTHHKNKPHKEKKNKAGKVEKKDKTKKKTHKKKKHHKSKAKALAEVEGDGEAPLWGREVKYSDTIANGDADDDKELEDEDDPNDAIADDDGFVNQWKIDPAKLSDWKWAAKIK